MKNIIYAGIFFDKTTENSVFTNTLERGISYPHVTFKFKPSDSELKKFVTITGEFSTVACTAYGNNNVNEGYLVDIVDGSFKMKELFKKIEVPHITTGLASNGKAVNTRFLDFKPIPTILLTGRFGFFTSEGPIFSLPT
jgi:hypothetical protein